MDSFEINKIIAAILVTVVVVLGIGKISDYLFNIDKLSVAAYKVEAMTKKEWQIWLALRVV